MDEEYIQKHKKTEPESEDNRLRFAHENQRKFTPMERHQETGLLDFVTMFVVLNY